MSEPYKNTLSERVLLQAKDIVVKDARKAEGLLKEAVSSKAYLYPIKGLYYFASHPDLWKPLKKQLAPTIMTGISVTAFMFIFAYLPQAAVLTFTSGPVAFVTTALLVLSESSTITNMLARGFFIEDALVDTFDGTLLARNQATLVSQGRDLKAGRSSAGDVMARMGKMIKKPLGRFAPSAFLRYLIYLPLNMIPVVGTVLFVLLQARKNGPGSHTRYFQLKGWSKGQKDEWVEKRRAEYTGFGLPAVLLEMIPFVGVFFAFTNAVGAALWAADIEDGSPTPQTAQLRNDELPEQETGVVGEET